MNDERTPPQKLSAILLPYLLLAVASPPAAGSSATASSRGGAGDRFVTVKGVAEREAKADVALWPLRLSAADNDLAAAQARIARNTAAVYGSSSARAWIRRRPGSREWTWSTPSPTSTAGSACRRPVSW